MADSFYFHSVSFPQVPPLFACLSIVCRRCPIQTRLSGHTTGARRCGGTTTSVQVPSLSLSLSSATSPIPIPINVYSFTVVKMLDCVQLLFQIEGPGGLRRCFFINRNGQLFVLGGAIFGYNFVSFHEGQKLRLFFFVVRSGNHQHRFLWKFRPKLHRVV